MKYFQPWRYMDIKKRLFPAGALKDLAVKVPRGGMVLSGLFMTGTAVAVAGMAVAAAGIPFILPLIWYVERKGVDSIVDAGFTLIRKRLTAEKKD